MPKRITEESIRRQQAGCARVKLLLEHRWNGSQTDMAEALGVTQSLVSKIVRGKQGPGKEFLAALARQPGVNAEWVLHGEGQPFPPSTKGMLPIALAILPGWPERYLEKLTGQWHPVAEPLHKPSRYWVKVEAYCPLLGVVDLALLPGDLLLFDADQSAWADNFEQMVGRLFGTRVSCESRTSYEMGRLSRDAAGLFIDLFGRTARLPVPQPMPSERERKEAFDQQFGRPRRNVRTIKKKPDEQSAGEGKETAPPPQAACVFEGFVAVRVYLVRP